MKTTFAAIKIDSTQLRYYREGDLIHEFLILRSRPEDTSCGEVFDIFVLNLNTGLFSDQQINYDVFMKANEKLVDLYRVEKC